MAAQARTHPNPTKHPESGVSFRNEPFAGRRRQNIGDGVRQGGDDDIRVLAATMLQLPRNRLAISGAHQNCMAPSRASSADIARRVADQPAAGEIDTMILCCTEQHTRRRLAACTGTSKVW